MGLRSALCLSTLLFSVGALALPNGPFAPLPADCKDANAKLAGTPSRAIQVASLLEKELFPKEGENLIPVAVYLARTLANGDATAEQDLRNGIWTAVSGINSWWHYKAKKARAEKIFNSLPEGKNINHTLVYRTSPEVRRFVRLFAPTNPEFKAPPKEVQERIIQILNDSDPLVAGQFNYWLSEQGGYHSQPWVHELMSDIRRSGRLKNGLWAKKDRPTGHPVFDILVNTITDTKWGSPTKPIEPEEERHFRKADIQTLGQSVLQGYKDGMTAEELGTMFYLFSQGKYSAITPPIQKNGESEIETHRIVTGAGPRLDLVVSNIDNLLRLQGKPEVVALTRTLTNEMDAILTAAKAPPPPPPPPAPVAPPPTPVTPVAAAAPPPPTPAVTPPDPAPVVTPAPKTSVAELWTGAQEIVAGRRGSKHAPMPSTEQRAAASQFGSYYRAVDGSQMERSETVDVLRRAAVGKLPVLFVGPPGTAKTDLADKALGNMVDDSGRPSYFAVQLGEDSTLNDTHGPYDPKELTQNGKYVRITSAGAPGFKNVFFDEVFDPGPSTQRNTLDLIANRRHRQGGVTIQAQSELFISATNKYIPEVYERAGDDRPKANQDRYAYIVYVPDELEFAQSGMRLVLDELGEMNEKIKFSEVDKIRELVPQTVVPPEIALGVNVLFNQMRKRTKKEEAESKEAYLKKIAASVPDAEPAYRSTRVYSPRSLRVAGKVLRVGVVNRWADSPDVPLVADWNDVKGLEGFFITSGPSHRFMKGQLARASQRHEKAQINISLLERGFFKHEWKELNKGLTEGSKPVDVIRAKWEKGNITTETDYANALERLIKVVQRAKKIEKALELEQRKPSKNGLRNEKVTYKTVGQYAAGPKAEQLLSEILAAPKPAFAEPKVEAPTAETQTTEAEAATEATGG